MNWVFWGLLVVGIGGPLLAALLAAAGSVRLYRQSRSGIHLIRPDSIIEPPSQLKVRNL